MAFDGCEFGKAIPEYNDAPGSAGDVNPTGWNAEVEKIGLIDVNGDVDRHIRHARHVSVAATEERKEGK